MGRGQQTEKSDTNAILYGRFKPRKTGSIHVLNQLRILKAIDSSYKEHARAVSAAEISSRYQSMYGETIKSKSLGTSLKGPAFSFLVLRSRANKDHDTWHYCLSGAGEIIVRDHTTN